jgi:succinate dehydrogenase/fumarate reductase flavoprotein subunit
MTPQNHVTVDIAVIGFGGAGAVAAIEAARLGADVFIVEKAPFGLQGGSTRVSAQGFLAPSSAADAAAYIAALAWPLTFSPGRVEHWATECCENPQWLADLGIPTEELRGSRAGAEFPDLPGSGAIFKRRVTTQDASLWAALQGQVEAMSIPVRFGYRAVGIERNARGRVESVKCRSGTGDRLTVRARWGVVLATGGYAACQQMLRNWAPDVGACETAGSPHSTGDGLILGSMVGARLSGLDAVSGPYLSFRPPGYSTTVPLEPLMPGRAFPGNGMLVGDNGRELSSHPNTRHGRVRRSGEWGYERLPQGARYLFDERLLSGGPLVSTGHLAPGWCRQVEGLAWSHDNQSEIAAGWIADLETDARPRHLVGVKGPAETTNSLRYSVKLSRSILNTHGGPERDACGRVLDNTGTPIPGLYSAGELGSIFPRLYQGAGNLADCLVSGRTAVRSAIQSSNPRSA